MNERIRELAEQAHSYACEYAQQPDYNPHNPYNQSIYKQRYDSKFAELIVDECLDILEDEDTHDAYGQPIRLATIRIKKLFGVEQ